MQTGNVETDNKYIKK